jgi:hypothetical protein
MKLLQETTDWQGPTPNHIYIFGSSSMKIVGYIKAGTQEPIKFSTPQSFDQRRRSFKQLTSKEMKAYDLSVFS